MCLESFEGESRQSAEGLQWYAAYTKHQHEKKSADLLTQKRIETYLPLYQSTRQWRDRKKKLELPLFPGYVFFRLALNDRLEVLKIPGVFFIVESGGHACSIPESDIEAIRRMTTSRLYIEPHKFLQTGDRVEICRGPLAGIRGILSRVKNRVRVVVCVETLRKAVAVETDLADIVQIRARKVS